MKYKIYSNRLGYCIGFEYPPFNLFEDWKEAGCVFEYEQKPLEERLLLSESRIKELGLNEDGVTAIIETAQRISLWRNSVDAIPLIWHREELPDIHVLQKYDATIIPVQ